MIVSRFARYQEIGGLIYIFGKADVDVHNRNIAGRYYNPGTGSFAAALLPFPGAIYLRSRMPRRLYRALAARLGEGRVFNYPYRSNKLKFFTCVRDDPLVSQHLPDTRLVQADKDIVEMLNRHNAVYLKPTNLSRGRGIYLIDRTADGLRLKDAAGNIDMAASETRLLELLRAKLKRKYLVQKAIPFLFQNHKTDFRIYLQKDCRRQWQYVGSDTKVAFAGSIVSNYRYHCHRFFPGEEGLKMVFGLSDKKIAAKLAEATAVCCRALELMEAAGHSLGDVAIDVIIDENLDIWLLEVQPDYHADLFGRTYMNELIHPGPLVYAMALAGFAGD